MGEIPLRAANQVHRIEMHGKTLAVNRREQFEIRIRRIRKHPRHGFERVERAHWFHRVNDFPNRGDDHVKRLVRQVGGTRPIPLFTARPGDVHATARADFFRQQQAVFAFLQRRLARGVVWAQGIAPRANLGNHDVRFLGSVGISIDLRVAGVFLDRAKSRAITRGAHARNPFFRGIVFLEKRATESHVRSPVAAMPAPVASTAICENVISIRTNMEYP